MTEPERDSTGAIVGPAVVQPTPAPPPQDEGEQGTTIEVDGDVWDIPPEPTVRIARATSRWSADTTGDPDVVIEVLASVLGSEQMADLAIDDDTSMTELGEITNGILKAAGEVWGVGNGRRSSRRQRSTGRR